MRDDAGASAVEFALLLPVFVLLVFGTISAGLAFSHKIAITQAAREGSRFGATLSTQVGMSQWLSQVQAAAIDAAGNDFTDGSPYVCVAYVAKAGSAPATQSLTQGGTLDPTQPCFTDGRTDSHVQVEMRRTADWNLGVTDATITLDSRSVSRYER